MTDVMTATSGLAAALSDPNRLRALAALRGGELCVCQIIALLDLAPSTVSKHMATLRQAGLVASRKEERWVYYRLPGEDSPTPVREALGWALESLAHDPQVREDKRRLQSILKTDPGELCRIQMRK
jgi:DNA-binding transcriptional ArsR family regulator